MEILSKRTERSRTYNLGGGRNHLSCRMAALHYPSVIDSPDWDQEIDFTPERVINAQFDGWQVQKAGWHYALGQPTDKATDGWVGFGGRQGQNWFKFRLIRTGYLHWPTRAWDDIGGTPTYSRANLSYQTYDVALGPNDEESVKCESSSEWRNLWTTPGDGELWIRWNANGDRLKERVFINQAGRDWIRLNHPPSTPLSETWFGFVFNIDWSDIPKVYRENILQNKDGDFTDDDVQIELKDSLDRLLAFMPIDDLIVHSTPQERVPLRKRFYKDGANHYLLVGVRCDVLNSLPAGDLEFDPTLNLQVGASASDAYQNYSSSASITATTPLYGSGDHTASPLQCNGQLWAVAIAQGSTINSAKVTLCKSGTAWNVNRGTWFGEDVDNASVYANSEDLTARTYTTASTAVVEDINRVDGNWYGLPNSGDDQTDEVQEIISRVGWSSGNNLSLLYESSTDVSWAHTTFHHYDSSSANAPKLDIDYTEAAGTTAAPTTLSPTTIAPTTLAPTTLPPTTAPPLTGTVCWGHETGVEEDYPRTFSLHWTGTADISGAGDTEIVTFYAGDYEESETWNIGAGRIKILTDKYRSGSGSLVISYKSGDSKVNCESDSWHVYSAPFTTTGWIKIRIECV